MWAEERGPPPLGPCLVPACPRPGPSMGQQSFTTMNSATSGKTSTRTTGYHQKALAEIRNSLLPFANIGSESTVGSSAASTISTLSTTSGVSSASGLSGFSAASGGNGLLDKDIHGQALSQLHAMGYTEEASLRALKQAGYRIELALDSLVKQQNECINGIPKVGCVTGLSSLSSKLMRKPSLEREVQRGSPALDSGAGSSRSDSPRLVELGRQYSPPPLPPPRSGSTPPPPPPPHHGAYPSNLPQLLKRMSPAPVVPTRPPAAPPPQGGQGCPPTPQRGTSPVAAGGRQPMVLQNGPQVQQQLSQQMQALYQSNSPSEPPPPYPLVPTSPGAPPPPSYSASIQSRQSPTQDYRKSPSSGIYSGPTSAGSPSPVTVPGAVTPPSVTRPTPMLAWAARQAKTQPPIIMQSVKSTQVQKPVLQTAIAPTAPPSPSAPSTPATSSQSSQTASSQAGQPPPPSYASSIQQKQQAQAPAYPPKPPAPSPVTSVSGASPVTVPTTEPPSYASTMQVLAVQRGMAGICHPMPMPPPPPYGPTGMAGAPTPNPEDVMLGSVATVQSSVAPRPSSSVHHAAIQRKYSPIGPPQESPPNIVNGEMNIGIPQQTPPLPPTASSSVSCKNVMQNGDRRPTPPSAYNNKVKHQSPIPERRHLSKEKEEERRDSRVRNYSPQAFKFYMEQHIENVFKSQKARLFRIKQLENEMTKADLSNDAQFHMRKILSKRESNYIRMKRAKMDKSMFTKITTIGVGAFGEVTLVKKVDTKHLYAMKTLRKADVLKRNQVAHVKAERDILAEADNEWVVKLYYSFQDKDNLYFVMDYVAGGDLMSLLCKLGVFEESLARFYIAELTCAVESVHKMGFIHRDIKPDNILIDSNGHLKLTDFGLCTGFRWTHNSKYYQINGEHARQDSMDLPEDWSLGKECRCNVMKPLERRRRREHQRCLAHSLVGTPNYIAPEVLQRTGYTQLCDWWSVGVILYEMLVGSPPFLANTPGETQCKVINWKNTLHIPKAAKLSPESSDLILKLCTSADRRLGKNANEVKEHPYFASVNFDSSLRKQKAPYTPRIKYSTDTSNFDPVAPERLRNSDSSGDSDEPIDNDNHPFHGFFEFTFRRFFDEGGWPQKLAVDDNDNQSPVYV